MKIAHIPSCVLATLRDGVIIPALPLALTAHRQLDERRQKALIRYYLDAGAGGVAVGVHATQPAIRKPEFGLLKPVLQLAAETMDRSCAKNKRAVLKVVGVYGRTRQAAAEISMAHDLGYHACLPNLSAFPEDGIPALIAHCQELARHMPLIGCYDPPALGGRPLPYEFWREFVEIENVLAINVAVGTRHQTLDVVRAICDAGRHKEITLYTGNADHLVLDLLQEYRIPHPDGARRMRFKGGMLGHWSVWTHSAVQLLERLHRAVRSSKSVSHELLTQAAVFTECHAAITDAANNHTRYLPGLHEVLRRQGLLQNTLCLDPQSVLSTSQATEIERILCAYPDLSDDVFVQNNLACWLRD